MFQSFLNRDRPAVSRCLTCFAKQIIVIVFRLSILGWGPVGRCTNPQCEQEELL